MAKSKQKRKVMREYLAVGMFGECLVKGNICTNRQDAVHSLESPFEEGTLRLVKVLEFEIPVQTRKVVEVIKVNLE